MDKNENLLFLTFVTNQPGDITKYSKTPSRISSASTRLQVVPMLNAAEEIGITPSVWSLHAEDTKMYEKIRKIKNIKYVVIGKMSADTGPLISSMILANSAIILYLKAKGVPLILLYSDNHIVRDDAIGQFYRSIFSYTNLIITPSTALQETVNKYTNRKIACEVVNDPWQADEYLFKKNNEIQKKVNLVWFGNPRNINYLVNCIENIINKCHASEHYHLRILTRSNGIKVFKQNFPNNVVSAKKWTIEYLHWNDNKQPEQFNNTLAKSDISILPSNPADPRKSGVSHNRLVDSVRSGCITVASPLRSYLELSKCCLIGDSFAEMIDHAILNYDDLCDKFQAARQSTLNPFSPAENTSRWKSLLEALMLDKEKKSELR